MERKYPELERSYKHFLSVRESYLEKHHLKFILIQGEKVFQVCDSFEKANSMAFQLELKPGTYVIQQLLHENEPPSVFFEIR